MVTRCVRIAVCAALGLALWNVAAPVGHAQRYGAPKPKPRIYYPSEDSDDQNQGAQNNSSAKNSTAQNGGSQMSRPTSSNRTGQSSMQSRQQPRQMTPQKKVVGQGKPQS